MDVHYFEKTLANCSLIRSTGEMGGWGGGETKMVLYKIYGMWTKNMLVCARARAWVRNERIIPSICVIWRSSMRYFFLFVLFCFLFSFFSILDHNKMLLKWFSCSIVWLLLLLSLFLLLLILIFLSLSL